MRLDHRRPKLSYIRASTDNKQNNCKHALKIKKCRLNKKMK